MTVRLSDEARRHIALFEEATGVAARDCVVEDERVVFVVPAGDMPDAIGPGGRHVSRVEERVGTDVELVEDADEPGTFVANALRPAAVYGVTVRERETGDGGANSGDRGRSSGRSRREDDASRTSSNSSDGAEETVAYAEVDRDDMGAAIGSGGRNVRMAVRLAERHFGVDAVELVPDPDSCIEAVAEATGVEPHDCLFDPVDERLLVLAPRGKLRAVVGSDGSHVDALRGDLGWPVEVIEYGRDAATLITNALAPATVHNVTVSEGATTVAYAEVDRADTGVAIGTDGRRIRRARVLARRYYGVDDVVLP